jgi:tetratricopeptide (TPR) repeat protein
MVQSRFTERESCSEIKIMKNGAKKTILTYEGLINPPRGLKLSSCILCFSFFAVLISVSASASKIDYEQIDPTNFLVADISSKPDYLDASFSLYEKLSTPVSTASGKQEKVPSDALEQKKHRSDVVMIDSIIDTTEKKTIDAEISEVSTQPEKNPVYNGLQSGNIKKDSADTSEDVIVPAELLQKQKNSPIAQKPDSSIETQIWKTRITSPKNQSDQAHRAELMKIIEQIRAIEFHEEPDPEPVIVIESPPQEQKTTIIDTNDIWMQEQTVKKAQKSQNESQGEIDETLKAESLPCNSLTPETLQLLENLSKKPEKLANPLGLADILYESKQLNYAAIFYQEALKRAEAQSGNKKNIDWMLFQIGNCLAKEEPQTALKMYRRMITEYPNSSLAYVADAKERLISWYLKDKPQSLINQQ